MILFYHPLEWKLHWGFFFKSDNMPIGWTNRRENFNLKWKKTQTLTLKKRKRKLNTGDV
jgi:hypothetical protein